MPDPLRIFVTADPPDDEALLKTAARLAVDLDLPFLEKPKKRGVDVLLVAAAGRLELRMIGGDPVTCGGRAVCCDLSKIDIHSAAGTRIRQPIAKAIGIKKVSDPKPTVIDATAGWGEDSWLLAALGCRVLAVERNRIVFTLLRDGLWRAAADEPQVAGRITLVKTNGVDLLRGLGEAVHAGSGAAGKRSGGGNALSDAKPQAADVPPGAEGFFHPDVVYLDPMFPPRRKGAEGKPLRVLRQLVGDDDDAAELLRAARRLATRRVVVKRPLHGEPIAGEKPTTTHKGKSLRYDVYAKVER